VPGDPADVGHAPIDVFGMNVLIVLGGAGDVSEIPAGAVLAAFGFSSRAAGIHEKERGLGVQRDRLNGMVAIFFQDLVDEEVAAHDHRCVGRIFPG